jgi:hypothetical protein
MDRRLFPLVCCLVTGLATTLACTMGTGQGPPTPTPAPTHTPYPTNPPASTNTLEPTATRRPLPTSTPHPAPSCKAPADLTSSDKGQLIEICGRIVDEGTQDCPDCPYGVMDYLTFEGGFNIISYYWNFSSYEGLCLKAKDTVELMGAKPIFVYGAREGYAGSVCSADSAGTLSCGSGDYFQYYEECD